MLRMDTIDYVTVGYVVYISTVPARPVHPAGRTRRTYFMHFSKGINKTFGLWDKGVIWNHPENLAMHEASVTFGLYAYQSLVAVCLCCRPPAPEQPDNSE